MVLLVKVLSIAIIVYGCSVMLRPRLIKKVVEWAKEGNNVAIANAAKVVIGIILMIASSYCSVPWVVLFLGALSAFTGALAFVIKKNIVMHLLDWVDQQPSKTVYALGIVFLAIGALLALAA